MVPFPQKEEHSSEPQMVNDDKLRLEGEISRKDCIEYLGTLRNFNSYVYQEFVHLLKDFKPESDERIGALKQKVKDLFEGCPDLILGFNAFLPKRHKFEVPIPVKVQTSRNPVVVLSRKRNRYDDTSDVHGAESNDSKLLKVIDFVNKVRGRFRQDDEEGDGVFQSFIDIFMDNHYKRNKSSPNKSTTAYEEELQIYRKVEALFDGHRDLVDEFAQFVPTLSPAIVSANGEACTPSYRRTPETFLNHASAIKTNLASQVLNDQWVSIPSATSRERGGLNSFKWEDERFEADREVNTVKSTSESISALMEKIEKGSQSKIYIEDHLNQVNLMCIQKCYDKQGLKAMDELKKDIRKALPLLLERLKQREKVLTQRQHDLQSNRRKN